MLLKVLGCEFEASFRHFYGEVDRLGQLMIEPRSVVRGRRWLDYMRGERCLEFFLGQTHIVLCRS
jgi:hypothetical protein